MLGVFAKANLPGTLVQARPASPPRPGETIVEVSVVQMRGQDESAQFAVALESQERCADACAAGEEAVVLAVGKFDAVDADEPMTPPMEFDERLLAEIQARKAQDAAKAAQLAQLAQQVPPASPSDWKLGQWRKRKASVPLHPRHPKTFATKPGFSPVLGGRTQLGVRSDSDDRSLLAPRAPLSAARRSTGLRR